MTWPSSRRSEQPGRSFWGRRRAHLLLSHIQLSRAIEQKSAPPWLWGCNLCPREYPDECRPLGRRRLDHRHAPGAQVHGEARGRNQCSGAGPVHGRRSGWHARDGLGCLPAALPREPAGTHPGQAARQKQQGPHRCGPCCYSSRYTFSRRSCISWASRESVAMGRASRRAMPIGSPVSSQ